jgi:glycine hydroxymethyltransferase
MKKLGMNPTLVNYMKKEAARQEDYAQLIASENFASEKVRELSGSILTNKYAEGYPGERYYNGCEWYDDIEYLAMRELQRCFDEDFLCNVQPHSGANANLAVMMGLLKPGDTILSLSLGDGGHLSHGHKVNISGKLFNIIQYGVDSQGWIDEDQVDMLAAKHEPKMIIAGASAYPRRINWEFFNFIAKREGAILLADIAHYSGLIAGGVYPSPFGYADVITSTTHKTLRGPRGGVIMWQDDKYTKKINGALFPGTQGGPLMNQVAAKVQAFYEARQPEFREYAKNVVDNAWEMADEFRRQGMYVVTDGTDSHIILLDLKEYQVMGSKLADRLEQDHQIVVNKNSVPGDPLPPKFTSGIRIGTAAETTRGKDAEWFREIARTISNAVMELA